MCAERYLISGFADEPDKLSLFWKSGSSGCSFVFYLPRGSKHLLREHILKRVDVHDADSPCIVT